MIVPIFIQRLRCINRIYGTVLCMILPFTTYIHEVEEKITAEPVENVNPTSEAVEKKEATDGVQLSLF